MAFAGSHAAQAGGCSECTMALTGSHAAQAQEVAASAPWHLQAVMRHRHRRLQRVHHDICRLSCGTGIGGCSKCAMAFAGSHAAQAGGCSKCTMAFAGSHAAQAQEVAASAPWHLQAVMQHRQEVAASAPVYHCASAVAV